jgi:hypothetical protein
MAVERLSAKEARSRPQARTEKSCQLGASRRLRECVSIHTSRPALQGRDVARGRRWTDVHVIRPSAQAGPGDNR